MRTIIAAPPDFTNWSYFNSYLHIIIPPWEEITEVISTHSLGTRYANKHKLPQVHINDTEVMSQYADGLIAFWDYKDDLTKNMIEMMEKKSKWIVVIRTDIKWEKEMVRGVPKLNNVSGRFGGS